MLARSSKELGTSGEDNLMAFKLVVTSNDGEISEGFGVVEPGVSSCSQSVEL